MQHSIVPLRPLMPLLALLYAVVCAWDAAAATPEAFHTADARAALPTPHITVNIAARRLYLYDERATLVTTYPVAVGAPRYPTPIRTQAVRAVVWNAWWVPPPSPWARHAKPTPPGKNNPLGNIKMPLGDSLLLHGTNQPRSIGTAASHGCIRLLTRDAQELARWLQRHSTAHHTDAVFAQYATQRHRSVLVPLEPAVPVDLVYTYAEVIADQLHVHYDVYGRIRNKWAHVMQTLAANGYAADGLDQATLQARLTRARFRDVVIALAEIRRPPPPQPPLARHSIDR